jgi:hypothetical protein
MSKTLETIESQLVLLLRNGSIQPVRSVIDIEGNKRLAVSAETRRKMSESQKRRLAEKRAKGDSLPPEFGQIT